MPRCLDGSFRMRSLSILFLVSFCAAVFVVINENILGLNENYKVNLKAVPRLENRLANPNVIRALQNQKNYAQEDLPQVSVTGNDSERALLNNIPPLQTKSVETPKVSSIKETKVVESIKKTKKKGVVKPSTPKPPSKLKYKRVPVKSSILRDESVQATLELEPNGTDILRDIPKNVVKIGDFAKCYNFKIDHPNLCDPDEGQSLPLLVIVSTGVSQVESRDAIRSTWGGSFKQKNAKVLFLLGTTEDPEMQQYVEDENKVYHDIIQADFLDNYENLTLKSVSLMKWVSVRCPRVPFVLKTDDDMMINVDLILEFALSRAGQTKSIFGKVAKHWKPHRNKANKYFVSNEQFPGKHYPYFCTGPAYLFSGDSAKLLYEGSLSQAFLRLEDVVLTGIVAQNVGVVRWNQPLMKNVPVKVNICTFKEMMTSHKHTPENLEVLWEEVTRPGAVCNVPSAAPKKTKK